MTDRPTIPSEIEITPAMIEAGAKVLWVNSDLDIGPTAAEIYAEAVLRAALPLWFHEKRKSAR